MNDNNPRNVIIGNYVSKANDAIEAASHLENEFFKYKNSIAMLTNWATEVYLKCFLYNQGYHDKEIQILYKHRIDKLFSACCKIDPGLELIIDIEIINLVNIFNFTNGGIRYPQRSTSGYVYKSDTTDKLRKMFEYIATNIDQNKIVEK